MTDTENNAIDTAEVEQETKDLTSTLYKNVQRAFNNNYALACWSKKNIEAIQKSEEPEDKKALQMTKFMNLNIVISELVLAITDTALFSESLGKKKKGNQLQKSVVQIPRKSQRRAPSPVHHRSVIERAEAGCRQ